MIILLFFFPGKGRNRSWLGNWGSDLCSSVLLTRDGMEELQDLRVGFFCFNWGCLDRMAGLQDLQDRLFWLNWGLFGQDGRITRFTGRLFWAYWGEIWKGGRNSKKNGRGAWREKR